MRAMGSLQTLAVRLVTEGRHRPAQDALGFETETELRNQTCALFRVSLRWFPVAHVWSYCARLWSCWL